MKKKIFPVWASQEEIDEIKVKAKKEKRSASNYILNRALETPNLALGDFWNNPETLRKVIREVKKEQKKK